MFRKLKSGIQHLRRYRERRAVLVFGLTYQTPLEVLVRMPELIEEIVRSDPTLRFECVHFKGFGTSSLDFEVAYFVEHHRARSDLDSRQPIDSEIRQRFTELGACFAYPLRSF